jgi:hypothetical protein
MKDALEMATAVLISLGGGSVIVWALSSWLGKVWANRILESDRRKAEEALADFRARLDRETSERLATLERTLDLEKDRLLSAHTDKLAIYRDLTDVVANLVADWAMIFVKQKADEDVTLIVERFERGRLRIYGYLGMLAPQSVMTAHDALVDYLLNAIEGTEAYSFAEMRRLAIEMLNAIRVDIGIDSSPIRYTGTR